MTTRNEAPSTCTLYTDFDLDDVRKVIIKLNSYFVRNDL